MKNRKNNNNRGIALDNSLTNYRQTVLRNNNVNVGTTNSDFTISAIAGEVLTTRPFRFSRFMFNFAPYPLTTTASFLFVQIYFFDVTTNNWIPLTGVVSLSSTLPTSFTVKIPSNLTRWFNSSETAVSILRIAYTNLLGTSQSAVRLDSMVQLQPDIPSVV